MTYRTIDKHTIAAGLRELMRVQAGAQYDNHNVVPDLLEGEQFARYFRDNTLACLDELHEALRETRWKPWKSDPGKGPTLDGHRALKRELVDALLFYLNLVLASGMGPAHMADLFAEVTEANYARHRDYENVPMHSRDVREAPVLG